MVDQDVTLSKVTTSWVWQADNAMHGATIDTGRGIVEWFDMPGCSCGGSALNQTYAQFLEKGAMLNPPEDVLAEMHHAVQTLMHPAEPE